jgi:predicted acyltransferase
MALVAPPPGATQADIDLREPAAPPRRIVAVDAARGLAIVIMLIAVHPGPRGALYPQLKHAAWHGVHFADLFFPLFLFVIGAAMPFSSSASTGRRVLRRALLLVGLGLVVQLFRHAGFVPQGVLQHIAGSYVIAWLVLKARPRTQVLLSAAALAAYGAAFVAFSAPGVGPWSPEGGFAHTVNGWFFGGFRTEGVPQTAISAVNILVGAWVARRYLDGEHGTRLLRTVGLWAAGLIAGGLLLGLVVPLNKYLWTPSFTILTAGTSCAFFALLYWLADVRRIRKPLQPMVELGCNAIAVYVLFIGILGGIAHVRGPLDDAVAGVPDWVVTHTWSVVWLALGLLFAHALYRRRIFIKV